MPFFSLYLNILGVRKGPGKLFMGSWKVLEMSWIFVSKRVGTLTNFFTVRFRKGSAEEAWIKTNTSSQICCRNTQSHLQTVSVLVLVLQVFFFLPFFIPLFNTLTATAILGQTRLPLLNPKRQIPTFKKQSAFAADCFISIHQVAACVLYPWDAAGSFSPTLERRPMLQYDGCVYTSVVSALTGKGTC